MNNLGCLVVPRGRSWRQVLSPLTGRGNPVIGAVLCLVPILGAVSPGCPSAAPTAATAPFASSPPLGSSSFSSAIRRPGGDLQPVWRGGAAAQRGGLWPSRGKPGSVLGSPRVAQEPRTGAPSLAQVAAPSLSPHEGEPVVSGSASAAERSLTGFRSPVSQHLRGTRGPGEGHFTSPHNQPCFIPCPKPELA